MDSFSSDLGNTWVTDIRCEVLPVLDMNSFRQGDSMLAVALRRLDDMSDREVLEQCVGLLDAAPSRVLFPQNVASDPDTPIDVELVASIRNQVALALVETIRVEEVIK